MCTCNVYMLCIHRCCRSEATCYYYFFKYYYIILRAQCMYAILSGQAHAAGYSLLIPQIWPGGITSLCHICISYFTLLIVTDGSLWYLDLNLTTTVCKLSYWARKFLLWILQEFIHAPCFSLFKKIVNLERVWDLVIVCLLPASIGIPCNTDSRVIRWSICR